MSIGQLSSLSAGVVGIRIPTPGRYLAVTATTVLCLVFLSSAFMLAYSVAPSPATRILHKLFWIDTESNVATLLNFLLLLASVCLLVIVALRQHRLGVRYRWHWSALAAIFAVMSFDEAARVHERLIGPVRNALDLGGPLMFAWVVPGMIVVLVIALLYAGFLLDLPRRTAALLVAAGAVYVGGAIGMEMVGASIFSEVRNFDTLPYMIATTLEETFEMLGLCLFGAAILQFARTDPFTV